MDTLEEVETYRWSLRFPDPLSIVRLRLRLAPLSFPAPGVYQFTLFADGESIAQTIVRVSS
jgi:hypothetical protein